MFWRRKEKVAWPELSLEEIKKRARILVVDDSDFAYLPLFERDGYSLDKWDDVEDLGKLESNYYDIVLLDIQGVGTQMSNEAGLGVLRHIKEVSPAQIVVAFSNADFSLKYQAFFEMADSALSKGDDYVAFKRTVDTLLQQRFSLGFYVDRVLQLSEGQVSDQKRLRELTEKALCGRNTDNVEDFLRGSRVNSEAIGLILNVIQIGIALGSI